MLRISLLGEFRLEKGAGQRLPLTSRKLEWLFAYLVLHPTTHPRDRLAGQFWPDSEQDKANRSLRQALYILRPVIEPEDSARGIYLYASQTTVQFNKESPHWLDVKEFEKLVKESEALAGTEKAQRLQAAVSLYHGDLLDGCYEDWCLEARGYFRELCIKALQQLVLHHTEQKAYAQAIACAKQILAKNPLHEEMHRHLMYLYYASGDRNAALHQYHECGNILKTELNIEPLPETKDLFREIEQQTSLAQLEALASRARELIRRYPELSVPFVGRTEESQQFTLAWDKASQGQGQTFFMAGEAGVGKSRLAQEWLNFASTHGGWVLSGRCYEIEGKLSYQPIVEALRSGLSQITAESLGRISPIWMSEVIKLVPELGEKIPSLQPSAPLTMPLQERNRLFEGLFQFILSLSQEKPLLLFFDDLQWADESTLEFIHYLVRKLPTQKLFFLGTYRVEEVTEEHPLWKQLQYLQRDHLIIQIPLAPLQAEDLEKLLYGMLKSGELGELGQWVYERSKGIPFFAVELIKSFIEAGVLSLDEQECWQVERAKFTAEYIPSTVRSLIEMRLRRLSQLSRQVLDVAAVTSRAFTTELLAQTMGRQQEDMFDRIDELLRARVIVRDDSRYDFRHDLIRQVIYGTLLPERKRHLHKHVGEVLERTHAQRLDEIAGELAFHFLQAGLWPQAMEYSLRAGERAWKAYAKQEALDAFHRALDLAQKLEDAQGMMRAYKGLGQVCCFTDKHDEGLQYSLKALELCKDPYQRVDIYHAIANVYHKKADYEKALDYCKTSIQELGVNNQSIEMVKILDLTGTSFLHLRRFDEAIEYEIRCLRILEGTDQWSALALVYTHLGSAYRGKRDYDKAIEYCVKSVEMAERISDINAMATAYWWLANTYSYKGDSKRAIEWYQKAMDGYTRMDDVSSVASVTRYISFEFMRLQQLDPAITYAHKVLQIWSEMQVTPKIAESYAILGCLYDAQGSSDQGNYSLDKALQLAGNEGTLFTVIIMCYALLGEPDKAIKWLEKGITFLQEWQLEYFKSHPWFDTLRSDPRFHAILNQKH